MCRGGAPLLLSTGSEGAGVVGSAVPYLLGLGVATLKSILDVVVAAPKLMVSITVGTKLIGAVNSSPSIR
jgi:hypothetical protein